MSMDSVQTVFTYSAGFRQTDVYKMDSGMYTVYFIQKDTNSYHNVYYPTKEEADAAAKEWLGI